MNYLIYNINKFDENKIEKITSDIKPRKLHKINKIKNKKYQKQKIISEYILMKGIKKYFELDYKQLDFKINKNGKPYIKNKKNLYFNISHSNDYCIGAFSNKKIGVDIEKIRKVNINIINKFATENEKKYILKSKNNIIERLFEIYTLKEAYFKMKGKNLDNIKYIEFNITNNKIKCSDKNVKLKIKKNIEGYIISFCEHI